MGKAMDTQQLSERVITPMSKHMVERINDFRFENRCENRSEAVRRLIEIGLAASRSQKMPPKSTR